jgi:SAM-dependent methyltransferase/uncharacterized protein YbaR (Trm112 family)
MKEWILEYLQCPQCSSRLRKQGFQDNERGETIHGVLVCLKESCHAWYPIVRGIPRMLPESLRLPLTQEFIREHHQILLDQKLIKDSKDLPHDDLHQLKKDTIRNFGFEWTEFSRFGWDDEVYNKSYEETVFLRKTLLKPAEIKDKLVLDAGCGNGRYCEWAAQYGGRVIGVDLGDGVESAYKNTLGRNNVQIIQGDILHLPIRDGSLDVIYSIGVLMHTGDAKKATKSLVSKLKQNGSITVHVYGKGNWLYEFCDKTIRDRTTKMSIEELQAFTKKMYSFRRWMEKIFLAEFVNLFVKIDPHPHCIFDWYAAPIATHHTYSEVRRWFEDFGIVPIETNEGRIFLSPRIKTRNKYKLGLIRCIKKLLYPMENIPITVRGQKK